MSALAARLAGLDDDVRALAKAMWRAHGLPPLSDLSAEQVGVVRDWLDWMVHEGVGWPEPRPVELPPVVELEAIEVPPAPADSVVHECGPVIGRYGMRNQRLLRPSEACPDCGWSSGLPFPRLADVAAGLVNALGSDDAEAVAVELLALVRESTR